MIRRVCTLITVAATAAVAFAASASAVTTTPTRMDAYETGWNGMVQRPGKIDIGNGPYAFKRQGHRQARPVVVQSRLGEPVAGQAGRSP
jgi:hypothetical protein